MSLDTLKTYFDEARTIAVRIDLTVVDAMIDRLARLKSVVLNPARLFICGVGGSAANASHAASDFRKLCRIEAYAPTDNVAEVTARTNDDGWEQVFASWLKVSKASARDVLLILSVGGGRYDASRGLIRAMEEAQKRRMDVLAIVGDEGGYAGQHATLALKVPVPRPERRTPHTEAFQLVVLHAMVNDERLKG